MEGARHKGDTKQGSGRLFSSCHFRDMRRRDYREVQKALLAAAVADIEALPGTLNSSVPSSQPAKSLTIKWLDDLA